MLTVPTCGQLWCFNEFPHARKVSVSIVINVSSPSFVVVTVCHIYCEWREIWMETMAFPHKLWFFYDFPVFRELTDFIFSGLDSPSLSIEPALQVSHQWPFCLLAIPLGGFPSLSLLSPWKVWAPVSLKCSFHGFYDFTLSQFSLGVSNHSFSPPLTTASSFSWPLKVGIWTLIALQPLVSLQANALISVVLLPIC